MNHSFIYDEEIVREVSFLRSLSPAFLVLNPACKCTEIFWNEENNSYFCAN